MFNNIIRPRIIVHINMQFAAGLALKSLGSSIKRASTWFL